MKRTRSIYLIIIIVLLLLIPIIWIGTTIFEGERPQIKVYPTPEYLNQTQQINIEIRDKKRGIRRLRVFLKKDTREIEILNKIYAFRGFLNRDGIHETKEKVILDPHQLSVPQGRLDLYINVWDYSRRRGGDGNLKVFHHRMILDTIPPHIRPITRLHNIREGGSCLIIYEGSKDIEKSGVYVNDLFFPGYYLDPEDGIFMCIFALPRYLLPKGRPKIYLYAKDKAGNETKRGFYYHILRGKFCTKKINITDEFLDKVLPYFSFVSFKEQDTPIERFLKINREVRKENHETIYSICKKTTEAILWEGPWLRQPNSATMARFGDHRLYFYKGKKIDEQLHLGVDLASIANSPVLAANTGKVIYGGRLGIYGETVIIDHGMGIFSFYGHLNSISVKKDDMVKKGDIIGQSDSTGLAGGDHLHFSMLVSGIFVNPIEWWDPHWIKDNIVRKMALLKEEK